MNTSILTQVLSWCMYIDMILFVIHCGITFRRSWTSDNPFWAVFPYDDKYDICEWYILLEAFFDFDCYFYLIRLWNFLAIFSIFRAQSKRNFICKSFFYLNIRHEKLWIHDKITIVLSILPDFSFFSYSFRHKPSTLEHRF